MKIQQIDSSLRILGGTLRSLRLKNSFTAKNTGLRKDSKGGTRKFQELIQQTLTTDPLLVIATTEYLPLTNSNNDHYLM